LAGCGLFFPLYFGFALQFGLGRLGFWVSLVVSVGFSKLDLWVPLGFGSSGCFFVFFGRFGFCGCCWGVLLFLGVFLGFGFVSASRILPVYWGALRFLIKLLFTYQKKKG